MIQYTLWDQYKVLFTCTNIELQTFMFSWAVSQRLLPSWKAHEENFTKECDLIFSGHNTNSMPVASDLSTNSR